MTASNIATLVDDAAVLNNEIKLLTAKLDANQGDNMETGQMRYIIIDRHSGFIWGDTYDQWWKMDELPPVGPVEAARSLDQSVSNDTSEMQYEITNKYDAKAIYDIYTAKDCFPVVRDGQDQSMIDLVCKTCTFTASIARY